MRRAHSVRNYPRPSLALGADDLGMLREADETNEDVLRRQLLDKDRENDKVCIGFSYCQVEFLKGVDVEGQLQTQIQVLQAQLAQRPPLESVQQLEKEYKNLDLLLQGTQRENERCMAELDRARKREKTLEQALARLAGENWQSSLDIAPAPYNTAASSSPSLSRRQAPVVANSSENGDMSVHLEQVRMLILGMEQRLQIREEKLMRTIENAESEANKFEKQHKTLGP
ncbi:hypothetical protein C0992_011043 [Termitomyces sp. T32_za158]|nr:hypothetical protein C0992_011043 [Termitomyces sp. T32_za158]